MNTSSGMYVDIFVARQPIFTTNMETWGYELLFRHGKDVQTAVIFDGNQATIQVIADGVSLAAQGMRKQSKILINFPRNVLLGRAPYILTPERCVVEILETVQPEPEILEACQRLKNAGYLLALDDFVGQPGYEPLCALADIIKVEVLHKTPAQVRSIIGKLAAYDVMLLAEKVESKEMFEACKKMGFAYFQGFFFSKPEIIPGKKLTSVEATKIRLLKELSKPTTELEQLVQIIQTDISISYRLFRYINSVCFSFRHKIETVQRAAAMLGQQNLRLWLHVTILSDLNRSPQAQELVRISGQRGRFLQLLAQKRYTPLQPDSMFLLGFFSMLDAILNQNMAEILEEIPLDTQIKAALIGEPNSKYKPWLTLLRHLDHWNWSLATEVATILGIPLDLIGTLYLEAATWISDALQEGQ